MYLPHLIFCSLFCLALAACAGDSGEMSAEDWDSINYAAILCAPQPGQPASKGCQSSSGDDNAIGRGRGRGRSK